MLFLNVTWKSIGSIGKGQSTPGCEDSTQDLPHGASPSATLPKDFDSSKHISCEIPTVFPETSLVPLIDHGHAKFLDGTKEDTPLQIVNNAEREFFNSSRCIFSSFARNVPIEDFINPSYHKQGGDDSINFWSHLTFCGTESAGTLLNVPYSNIVERLHYGSQNFVRGVTKQSFDSI
ncbi:hypothetical protein BU17DRAFT_68776 [Hysterangium stoloniferum]|nr:hypothetical protein BU17DRAFT_68776 [Hysterangium stoloniferum]